MLELAAVFAGYFGITNPPQGLFVMVILVVPLAAIVAVRRQRQQPGPQDHAHAPESALRRNPRTGAPPAGIGNPAGVHWNIARTDCTHGSFPPYAPRTDGHTRDALHAAGGVSHTAGKNAWDCPD